MGKRKISGSVAHRPLLEKFQMSKHIVYGTYERATDSRLRLSLPREFEQLFPDDDPPVVCFWIDYSIAVFPQSMVDKFLKQLMAMSRDVKSQSFRNYFLANVGKLVIDSEHRLKLRDEDLAYLRRGKGPGTDETEVSGKEELVLSGLYEYVVIKTKANAQGTLEPEEMPEYGDFLERACCAMLTAEIGSSGEDRSGT